MINTSESETPHLLYILFLLVNLYCTHKKLTVSAITIFLSILFFFYVFVIVVCRVTKFFVSHPAIHGELAWSGICAWSFEMEVPPRIAVN